VDRTLIRTDRYPVPGPTARADRRDRRVDPWWSGKHAAHGGNVQVLAAPDGWPLWTSGMRPGREHDTTALRAHPAALPLLADAGHAMLADLSYEGEQAALTLPIKKSPAAGSPPNSAPSTPRTRPPSSCSTTKTAAPHDQQHRRSCRWNGSLWPLLRAAERRFVH
jgi:hypothetical protein